MKNIKGILISIALLMLLAGMSSCQENNLTTPAENQDTVIEDLKVQIINYTPASIEFASLYTTMKLYQTQFKENYYDCSGVFNGMQLEENQITELRTLFIEQQYTLDDIISEIKNIEVEAVDKANRDRREILEKMNNDLIDAETAKTMIRQLNFNTEKLINDSIRNLENKIFSKRREWTIKVSLSLDEQQAQVWKDYTMSNYKLFLGEIY